MRMISNFKYKWPPGPRDLNTKYICTYFHWLVCYWIKSTLFFQISLLSSYYSALPSIVPSQMSACLPACNTNCLPNFFVKNISYFIYPSPTLPSYDSDKGNSCHEKWSTQQRYWSEVTNYIYRAICRICYKLCNGQSNFLSKKFLQFINHLPVTILTKGNSCCHET